VRFPCARALNWMPGRASLNPDLEQCVNIAAAGGAMVSDPIPRDASGPR
jgi:hypothetical protein